MNTKLLRLLEDDCTLTTAQLAAAADLSEETVKAEIAQMEKDRVILGYKAVVDWDRTHLESVTALIDEGSGPFCGGAAGSSGRGHGHRHPLHPSKV